jgi:DNA-binding NtrC family response regulator
MTIDIRHAVRKVLLIDDDDLIAGSLRSYLVKNGCNVDVALDPREAERLMSDSAYDVIIVDPYLTGGIHHGNGDLLERVARLQRRATLFVLTAYSSPELARSAANCRATALLTKPQSVLHLDRLVRGASIDTRSSP